MSRYNHTTHRDGQKPSPFYFCHKYFFARILNFPSSSHRCFRTGTGRRSRRRRPLPSSKRVIGCVNPVVSFNPCDTTSVVASNCSSWNVIFSVVFLWFTPFAWQQVSTTGATAWSVVVVVHQLLQKRLQKCKPRRLVLLLMLQHTNHKLWRKLETGCVSVVPRQIMQTRRNASGYQPKMIFIFCAWCLIYFQWTFLLLPTWAWKDNSPWCPHLFQCNMQKPNEWVCACCNNVNVGQRNFCNVSSSSLFDACTSKHGVSAAF